MRRIKKKTGTFDFLKINNILFKYSINRDIEPQKSPEIPVVENDDDKMEEENDDEVTRIL